MSMPGTVEKAVVFASLFEGLDRAFGARLRTPPLDARLRSLGINLDRLAPAYPEEVWERAMEEVAVAFYPDLPLHERGRRLGHAFGEGLGATTIGKAVLGLCKVIGIRRSLKRLSQTFRSGANYLVVETTERSPTEMDIEVLVDPRFRAGWAGGSDLIPHYTLGVLQSFVEKLGPLGSEVRIMETRKERLSVRYRATWKDGVAGAPAGKDAR